LPQLSEPREAAAVADDGLAGDVAGGFGGEEGDDGADVAFRVAEAAQRRARRILLRADDTPWVV